MVIMKRWQKIFPYLQKLVSKTFAKSCNLMESDPNLILRYDPMGNLLWCCLMKKNRLSVKSQGVCMQIFRINVQVQYPIQIAQALSPSSMFRFNVPHLRIWHSLGNALEPPALVV